MVQYHNKPDFQGAIMHIMDCAANEKDHKTKHWLALSGRHNLSEHQQKESVTLCSLSSRQKRFYKSGAGITHLEGWIHRFQALLRDLPSACQEKHLFEW